MTQVVILLCAYADISAHIIIIAAFIPDQKTQIRQVVHTLAVSNFTHTLCDDSVAMALSQACCQCTNDGAVEGPPESTVGDQRKACRWQCGQISGSVVQF